MIRCYYGHVPATAPITPVVVPSAYIDRPDVVPPVEFTTNALPVEGVPSALYSISPLFNPPE